ncbi:MAG: transporter [Dethiosulfovibrio peptidovorans]|nr:MAG: transporter [Dethiosulfovibrio peptidovorans]
MRLSVLLYRTSLALSVLVILPCVGLGEVLVSGDMLSVEAVLSLAYEHNPSLMATVAREEQARQEINQAEAAALPHLGASLVARFSHEAATYPVVGPAGPLGLAYAGYRNAYQAGLSLNWIIYSSGAVSGTIRAKKLAFSGVRASSVRTGQAVENAVRKAYYGLQRARAKLLVAQDFLSLAEKHLTQVESFYTYGVVAKDQVLRVQVDIADGKLNVIRASNAVNVAWRALERAVGIDLREDHHMPEPQTEVQVVAPLAGNLVEQAMTKRPELVALECSRRSALALAGAAAGTRGPQVGLKGELKNTDDSFFPNDDDDWVVTLFATWELYDGGESKAKERRARAAAAEMLHSMDDLQKQVELEISSAQLNLESAFQRIEVARSQVASAEEDYRMAVKRYSASVGTNIDVLDARVALTNARTQLVDAVYDTYSARADLDYAMGVSRRFILDSESVNNQSKDLPQCSERKSR